MLQDGTFDQNPKLPGPEATRTPSRATSAEPPPDRGGTPAARITGMGFTCFVTPATVNAGSVGFDWSHQIVLLGGTSPAGAKLTTALLDASPDTSARRTESWFALGRRPVGAVRFRSALY